MANWFTRLFSSHDEPAPVKQPDEDNPIVGRSGFFTTEGSLRPTASPLQRAQFVQNALSKTFQRTASDFPVGVMTGDSMSIVDAGFSPMVPALDDSSGGGDSIKGRFNLGTAGIPDMQMSWFAAQGFLGWQTCAMIAQNWLVSKACVMSPDDAARNGYDITVNGAKDVDPDMIQLMHDLDKKHKIDSQIREFATFGRIFGVRHALFLVDSVDPDYYEKPFNPDGVTRGSYKGISQIDPYWITPMLDADAAGNPASKHFYEPTWWIINGKKYHRTHFVIYRRGFIPDVLKPSYYYGGMPLAQEIYERVYAAERCANESPQLLLTKRTNAIHTDVEKAMANQAAFEARMSDWIYFRDNFGIKVLGKEEVMEQFDTALADLDATIMTQYQLVAAIARIPSTKLLGTSPKGFNATGEYEEAAYHEELESIQSGIMLPLLERHHLCLMRSDIAPRLGIEPVQTCIEWRPLDAMTAKEEAEVNEIKSRTGLNLVQSGAINAEMEHERVVNDNSSGYNGIDVEYEAPREDDGGLLDDPSLNEQPIGDGAYGN